jgi:SNF2 family DNA or RNA helicase
MAVEQRIGRIHRYGQQDTVQVYNLVAEDTVEQKIYDLLDEKLLEIASVSAFSAFPGPFEPDRRIRPS